MFNLKHFLNNISSTKRPGGGFGSEVEGPLEQILERIKRDYPLKNYLIQESIDEQIGLHAQLIYNNIGPGGDFSKALYSYITFHQIYFHLKNYIMHIKGMHHLYREEFLDIYQDIFLDNFMIFRELDRYLDEEYVVYLNIWLDGFFLNIFNRVMTYGSQPSHRIQPTLFFVTILFLSLPAISKHFEQIPFTSLLHFHETTEHNWQEGLKNLKDLDFHNPLSNSSLNAVFLFTLNFLNLNLSFNPKGEFFFDEENTIRCLDFLEVLIDKTDDLIHNIKEIRGTLLNFKI